MQEKLATKKHRVPEAPNPPLLLKRQKQISSFPLNVLSIANRDMEGETFLRVGRKIYVDCAKIAKSSLTAVWDLKDC